MEEADGASTHTSIVRRKMVTPTVRKVREYVVLDIELETIGLLHALAGALLSLTCMFLVFAVAGVTAALTQESRATLTYFYVTSGLGFAVVSVLAVWTLRKARSFVSELKSKSVDVEVKEGHDQRATG